MVTAIEYRAMALEHHRWAGMCRSPESREEHFRLEKELLALAEREERLHEVHASEQPSNPQQSKIAPRQTGRARRCAGSRADTREGKKTDIVEILRQEHRNIESLLRVLERELSVFDRGERPDYEVVLTVINYFQDYPDSCHHPKEDMIVEKLKARDPIAAAAIGDLEAEHQEGTKRLRRVAQAVERVLSDQDLVREHVANIIRDFINHERQHMAREERVVFPAALNALRPKDWADIALKLADRYDPFYQPGFEEKFNRLRRNILKMEEEAEAERPH